MPKHKYNSAGDFIASKTVAQTDFFNLLRPAGRIQHPSLIFRPRLGLQTCPSEYHKAKANVKKATQS